MTDVTIKPLRGLWRSVGEVTAPPGSCKTLDNCCIRKPGIVEPLPDWTDAGTLPGAVAKVFDVPGDDVLVIYTSGASAWLDKSDLTSTAITAPDGGNTLFSEAGAAHLVRYRDRYYLTTSDGLLCFDSAGSATARYTGFPPPSNIRVASVTTTDAQAVDDGDAVAYRATFERELGDGSLIVGPPSSPIYHNTDNGGGNAEDPTITVGWEATSSGLVAGDYVALYRTNSVAEVSAASDTSTGDTMRLVKRVELTSTEISAAAISIRDSVPDTDLGVELYTNPGQSGSVKGHYPPPYLRDCALFKGCMIGVAYNEEYSISLRIPSGTGGSMNTDILRLNGIGLRGITGDTSSGTNTITNVSASHMKGIDGIAGQLVSHADFPAGTQVTSATGSTITADNNATGTTVGASISVYDILEVAGTEHTFDSPGLAGSGLQKDIMDADDGVLMLIGGNPLEESTAATGVPFAIRAIRASYAGTTFGVRGTNGDNYSPDIPELSETAKAADDSTQGNRIAWSEPDEPEHWPLVNRDTVGQGEILRLIVAGDICYIFNDQGEVYAMTGEPDAWRYDLVAEDVQLVSVGSVAAHEGKVYAWTNQGLVVFAGGVMIANLTAGRLAQDMRVAYEDYGDDETTYFTWRGEVAVDGFNKEVWLITGQEETLALDEGQPWIYNMVTDEWFRYADSYYRAIAYVEDQARMYVTRRPSASWLLSYANPFTLGGDKMDATDIELNRLDLGAPGVLKKWREVVWHFGPSQTGSETFAFVTTCDAETGGASVSTNYSPTFDASDSTNLPCHVARNCGMASTLRVQLTRATYAYSWQLEGITIRYIPLVDRTGARAA